MDRAEIRTCLGCGQGLLVGKTSQRYCSNGCRQLAYRARKSRGLKATPVGQPTAVERAWTVAPSARLAPPAYLLAPQPTDFGDIPGLPLDHPYPDFSKSTAETRAQWERDARMENFKKVDPAGHERWWDAYYQKMWETGEIRHCDCCYRAPECRCECPAGCNSEFLAAAVVDALRARRSDAPPPGADAAST